MQIMGGVIEDLGQRMIGIDDGVCLHSSLCSFLPKLYIILPPDYKHLCIYLHFLLIHSLARILPPIPISTLTSLLLWLYLVPPYSFLLTLSNLSHFSRNFGYLKFRLLILSYFVLLSLQIFYSLKHLNNVKISSCPKNFINHKLLKTLESRTT